MAASKSTDLAPIEEQYPVLGQSASDLQEAIRANFGDRGFQLSDLDRITVPAGGGTTWEIPTLEGPESVRELEGIIVAWTSPRAFWYKSLDESDETSPPDCWSDDGILGLGDFKPGSAENPSGRCDLCPKNEWGSGDEQTRSKACKEMRLLFMLRPGGFIPIAVSLPPTSIRPVSKYMMRLASGAIPYYGVVTKLTLSPQSSGKMKWSVAEPALARKLTPEERSLAKEYSETIRGRLETVSVSDVTPVDVRGDS